MEKLKALPLAMAVEEEEEEEQEVTTEPETVQMLVCMELGMVMAQMGLLEVIVADLPEAAVVMEEMVEGFGEEQEVAQVVMVKMEAMLPGWAMVIVLLMRHCTWALEEVAEEEEQEDTGAVITTQCMAQEEEEEEEQLVILEAPGFGFMLLLTLLLMGQSMPAALQ